MRPRKCESEDEIFRYSIYFHSSCTASVLTYRRFFPSFFFSTCCCFCFVTIAYLRGEKIVLIEQIKSSESIENLHTFFFFFSVRLLVRWFCYILVIYFNFWVENNDNIMHTDEIVIMSYVLWKLLFPLPMVAQDESLAIIFVLERRRLERRCIKRNPLLNQAKYIV